MNTILVVAPHPDDETLGCGGTLLKHKSAGDRVIWLIATSMTEERGYARTSVVQRSKDIEEVAKAFSFDEVVELGYPAAALDEIPKSDLVSSFMKVVGSIEPDIIYVPYRNDAHSDHACVYDAVISSSKSFRMPCVKRILAYETLSETDFDFRPGTDTFKPNSYVCIEGFIEQKLDILNIYHAELAPFPFPRSIEAIHSLAKVRGVQCNSRAAEAFMLIKEIV